MTLLFKRLTQVTHLSGNIVMGEFFFLLELQGFSLDNLLFPTLLTNLSTQNITYIFI